MMNNTTTTSSTDIINIDIDTDIGGDQDQDSRSRSPTMQFLNLHQQQSPPHFPANNQSITDDQPVVVLPQRRRGRPPGSKNKHKPPSKSINSSSSSSSLVNNIITTTTTDQPKPSPCSTTTSTTMSPYLLEVLGGSDIIAAIKQFCNHRKTGLSVLSGSGFISSASFVQPSQPPRVVKVCGGRFSLLSISATILPPSSNVSAIIGNDCIGKFVVSLAGSDGKMFCGAVVGPLIACERVYIVAIPFNNPVYERLPIFMDNADHNSLMIRNTPGYNANAAAAAGSMVSAPLIKDRSSSARRDNAQHQPTFVELLSTYGGGSDHHNPPTNFVWPIRQLHSSLL